MTAIRRDGQDTPFSDWIRRHSGLDSIKERLCVSDVDCWIHQYRAHHDRIGARAVDSIMLLEVKTFCADLPFPQRDTLTLVHELMCTHGKRSYRRVKGPGAEIRIVRSFGVIPFRMSGNRPDNSNEMLWFGRRIDIDTLVELLRFDRDPHSPSKKLEYRRHHVPSPIQTQPHLLLFQPDQIGIRKNGRP